MAFVEEYVATKGLDWIFKRIPAGFKDAISKLHERVGRQPPSRFHSVSDFWYEGVDEQGLGGGARVSIQGVVSPYAPLNPLHPSAVLGRQIERWLPARAPVDDFAHQDFLFWNDGIIALPETLSRKGFLSINDKYGLIGHGSLPVIVDLTSLTQRSAYDTVMSRRPVSLECTVTGKLVNFRSVEYEALWTSMRSEGPTALPLSTKPSFVVEADSLILGKPVRHLRGMVWIAPSNHKVIPIYCDISNFEDHAKAIVALGALTEDGARNPVARYDNAPITAWPGPVPPLNEELQESFRDF